MFDHTPSIFLWRRINPKRDSESGIGKFTILVFGLFTVIVIYGVYCIGPFFYCYFELENQMASLIRVASTNTDQEIRQKLLYHVKKLEIPIDPDEITILRDGQFMSISASYSEVFYITWQGKDYNIHTFHFDAYADGNF